jgi:hypothetical protein
MSQLTDAIEALKQQRDNYRNDAAAIRSEAERLERKANDITYIEQLYMQALKDFDRLHAAAAVVIEQHKQGELTDAAIYDLEQAL